MIFQSTHCTPCQFTSCLCVKATPARGVQYTPNTQGDDREYTQSRHNPQYQYTQNTDGQSISRLPTYSQTVLNNQQPSANLLPPQPFNIQYSKPTTTQPLYSQYRNLQPRIVNFPLTVEPSVHRECWANPYQVEIPGCYIQMYRGEWYNVCRYETNFTGTPTFVRLG